MDRRLFNGRSGNAAARIELAVREYVLGASATLAARKFKLKRETILRAARRRRDDKVKR